MHKITIAAALCVLLAGCTLAPTRDVSTAKCDTTLNAPCRVSIVAASDGKYGCSLGRFNVNPERLELTGRRKVDIVFTLSGKFSFCGSDGIDLVLLSDRLRVSGSMLPRWMRGDARACSAEFTLPFPANELPVDVDYPYNIVFRESDRADLCKIDPWIWNGR